MGRSCTPSRGIHQTCVVTIVLVMSAYIFDGLLESDRMSDAGAREYSTRGKLAVVWSGCPENQVVTGRISSNVALCLSESATQGGKSDGKDEREA
jgi:hypothetical protein